MGSSMVSCQKKKKIYCECSAGFNVVEEQPERSEVLALCFWFRSGE